MTDLARIRRDWHAIEPDALLRGVVAVPVGPAVEAAVVPGGAVRLGLVPGVRRAAGVS